MMEAVRQPAVFAPDDPRLVVAAPDEAQRGSVAPIAEAAVDDLPAVLGPARRRMPWGKLLAAALSGLALLALGLAIDSLIEELYQRSLWLGGAGLALAALAAVALTVMIARETIGLVRLATVESLRHRAEVVIASDSRDYGAALVTDMLSLTRRIPRLAQARARLSGHGVDIIDGRDLVALAERELMGPLDLEAKRLVLAASKRVSVVTTVSPRAAVDVIFVLVNGLRLMRQLAVLYGGRPGAVGLLKLFRQVLAHLAVTGGVGLTDGLVQQVVGHGLAARLSARLGEGMINGLLTARLGLLTIDVVRPMPFHALPRPALNDLAGSLIRTTAGGAGTAEPAKAR